jgi:hypothetical protein
MIAAVSPLRLELEIWDAEVIEELTRLPEGQERDELARTALRIGILALKQARGDLDIQGLRNEANRLLESLEQVLDTHQRELQNRLESALREYFDPNSGKLPERIQRLLGNGGELEGFLRRYIGKEDSEMSKTLLAHVGENSPLMQYLSPQQRSGFFAFLEEKLIEQREQLLRQFSLDNSDGALCRFLQQLREHHDQVSGDLQTKMARVFEEFSLDRPDSALSRLVRNVEEAQKKITAEFSLDKGDSALSRLRQELINRLAESRKELVELLEKSQRQQQEFHAKVREELAKLQARREEMQKSVAHGIEFQDVLADRLKRLLTPRQHLVEFVGDTPGKKPRSKVGDIVITLGETSAAEGARIVIEAKEEEGYTLEKALKEIAEACENREAQIGIFVFSRKVAPANVVPLFRWGNNYLVTVWDSDDPYTNVYLDAAILVAEALCVREARQRSSAEADIGKMEKSIEAIEKGLQVLDQLQTWTQTIHNNSKNILDRLEKWRKDLQRQLEQLRECLDSFRKLCTPQGS